VRGYFEPPSVARRIVSSETWTRWLFRFRWCTSTYISWVDERTAFTKQLDQARHFFFGLKQTTRLPFGACCSVVFCSVRLLSSPLVSYCLCNKAEKRPPKATRQGPEREASQIAELASKGNRNETSWAGLARSFWPLLAFLFSLWKEGWCVRLHPPFHSSVHQLGTNHSLFVQVCIHVTHTRPFPARLARVGFLSPDSPSPRARVTS
jgi:hypothetical protein